MWKADGYKTKTCGAVFEEDAEKQEAVSPALTAFHSLVESVYSNAYSDTNLTIEEFYYLSQQNCYYCNSEPLNKKKYPGGAIFLYNGLDRINSKNEINGNKIKTNHSRDNVVPCCKHCNFAKNDYSLNYFNTWIFRIQEFQNNKNTIKE